MKVILLNGSPNEHGCTDRALREVVKTLGKHGVESELIWIGKAPVPGCIACFACQKTKKCIVNDEVNEVAEKLVAADALVIGAPVYYASAAGQIICFLDRLFFSAGTKFAGKLGASIASCRRAGATCTFDELNKYFTIKNMPIVASQYWNQVHGYTAADVEQDEEGLQTMRTLGENMAWLLKSIDAGRKAGVPAPQYEKVIATNFIR
ncbi:MAG: flavodoxin family protein [Fusobacteriaceae bacterium]|jgi:multimeric flavodoxin WrbA|nr:flavodoxin family protein [Fusobacteriaceae bacterium]